MPSRENTVILAFIAVAVTAAVGIDTVVGVPDWLPFGLLLALGVVAPMLVNNYFDARDAARGVLQRIEKGKPGELSRQSLRLPRSRRRGSTPR